MSSYTPMLLEVLKQSYFSKTGVRAMAPTRTAHGITPRNLLMATFNDQVSARSLFEGYFLLLSVTFCYLSISYKPGVRAMAPTRAAHGITFRLPRKLLMVTFNDQVSASLFKDYFLCLKL